MPSDLFNSIATVVGVIVAVFGAFFFAFWIAMGIWAFNDIRSRSHDWLAIVLACLLVLIFPVVGLILYLMIRPKYTLAEVYDRALEEEALLREIEESLVCITCGIPVKEGWVYCPNCHHQLQHSCTNCKNLVRNEWEICVFCGTPQQRSTQATQAIGQSAPPHQAQPTSGNLFGRRTTTSPETATANGVTAEVTNPRAQAVPPTRPIEQDESIYRPA